MNEKVSLVIPCQNAKTHIFILLDNIQSWKSYPNEIVIIDSSNIPLEIKDSLNDFFQLNKIIIKIIHKKNLYPGAARNIGIKESSNSIIAFLDVLTLPDKNWLSTSLLVFKDDSIDGVWGFTQYEAYNRFQEIIRAATYGVLPVKTLPGSIIRKNSFFQSGLFVESTRAGEDSDWMARANLHDLNFKNSHFANSYSGLKDLNLISLIHKWYRNYLYGSKLPYLNAHKDIYFYAAGIFLIVVAFNWNSLSYNANMNGWDLDSIAYIPNVTKISLALISLIYFIVRGLVIPRAKGVPWSFLISLNFIPLMLISLTLDIVKTFSFIRSRLSSFFQ